MDKVILTGVKVKTTIGWYDWERQAPRDLIVDLTMGISNHRACQTDDLADTIDYEKVVLYLREQALTQHFLLLEALAEFVATILRQKFGIAWTRVRIIKPGILEEVESVSVEIERGYGED
jgi:dihydroneopterin aldolase